MLEGAIEPKAIAKQAKRLDFPAAALTDRNGLYAAMPFSDACIEEGRAADHRHPARRRPARRAARAGPPLIDWLPLYAQDEAGYRNLCALVSAAHLDRPVEEERARPVRRARRAAPRA